MNNGHELIEALNQIEKEKGITREVMGNWSNRE